jgi:hypothetical protein
MAGGGGGAERYVLGRAVFGAVGVIKGRVGVEIHRARSLFQGDKSAH